MRFLLIQIFFCVWSLSYSQDDGIYCADVDYYNSNTGTESSYRLTAEVNNGRLIQLNFPSGGHIDSEDFGTVEIEDNVAFARVYQGKTYRVTLISKGVDCFGDVAKVKRCIGKTKKGKRCKNMTDNLIQRCWIHNYK